MIVVPLLDSDPDTGKRIDYRALSHALEQSVRAKYETPGTASVKIHVIGFAKLVGDLIDGLVKVRAVFGLAAADRRR